MAATKRRRRNSGDEKGCTQRLGKNVCKKSRKEQGGKECMKSTKELGRKVCQKSSKELAKKV